jgi:hypothetical protein
MKPEPYERRVVCLWHDVPTSELTNAELLEMAAEVLDTRKKCHAAVVSTTKLREKKKRISRERSAPSPAVSA